MVASMVDVKVEVRDNQVVADWAYKWVVVMVVEMADSRVAEMVDCLVEC